MKEEKQFQNQRANLEPRNQEEEEEVICAMCEEPITPEQRRADFWSLPFHSPNCLTFMVVASLAMDAIVRLKKQDTKGAIEMLEAAIRLAPPQVIEVLHRKYRIFEKA